MEETSTGEEKPKKEEKKEETGNKEIDENKIIAILSYLGILCLVPLILKKDNEFVKFHAKQGLVLAVGWFFVGFPFIGYFLWVILAIFSIWGIINVLNGKRADLPIVSELAKKINI